ncbi:hypothetical protein C347_00547 [Cryptococcus neoformans AD2-60a]|nr:hypothetical protein C347_00547 [Cryptococcus neoformans var. grubii AD2-60a]OXC87142.1 hypothetical protein C344_00480 [Cryptococcus neoformans var. grubii AD1-7a]OXG40742.1 hypothetical protein C360_00520 [Cryptococcus neoformans var. grubii Bt15]OXG45406.1 hypothetical protein C359_00088 [Cryptococcus neoformans var. grubii Bt120]OXH39749.1 hypothetical protein J005_00475 [Cryptococcus neoformans var. grubii]
MSPLHTSTLTRPSSPSSNSGAEVVLTPTTMAEERHTNSDVHMEQAAEESALVVAERAPKKAKTSGSGSFDQENGIDFAGITNQRFTVFPMFTGGWNQATESNSTSPIPTHPANAMQSPNHQQSQQQNGIDPLLALRSPSATHSTTQVNVDDGLTPELRFPDETLASATAGVSQETSQGDHAPIQVDETAQQHSASGMLTVPSSHTGPSSTSELGQATKKENNASFSRSPELRVSHKLAERKRRKEMKDLFDELREELPADRGMKASKWEILTKAIEHIKHTKSQQVEMHREIEHLRRELEIARAGNAHYHPHAYPTYSIPYPPGPFAAHPHHAQAQPPTSGTTSQAQTPQPQTQTVAQPQLQSQVTQQPQQMQQQPQSQPQQQIQPAAHVQTVSQVQQQQQSQPQPSHQQSRTSGLQTPTQEVQQQPLSAQGTPAPA